MGIAFVVLLAVVLIEYFGNYRPDFRFSAFVAAQALFCLVAGLSLAIEHSRAKEINVVTGLLSPAVLAAQEFELLMIVVAIFTLGVMPMFIVPSNRRYFSWLSNNAK